MKDSLGLFVAAVIIGAILYNLGSMLIKEGTDKIVCIDGVEYMETYGIYGNSKVAHIDSGTLKPKRC